MATESLPTQFPFGLWKDDWTNAQELARAHPNTFEAPSVKELEIIVAGDLVKICNGTERFWARVVSVIGEEHPGGSRIIHAIVDNELLCNDYYDLGDAIQFRGWHVYSIEHKHESNDNAVAAVTSAVAVAAAAGAAAAAAGAKAALAAVIVPAAAAPPTEDAALAAAFAAYNREPADTE